MTLPVDPERYAAYLIAMAAMSASPGPAAMLVLSAGLSGRGGAIWRAIAGINAGTILWYGAASLGLLFLVARLPLVFELLTFCGILYLLWLAYGSFRAGLAPADDQPAKAANGIGRAPMTAGLVLMFSNPKALLFYTAVLPAFVDLARPIVPQLALFAAATLMMDTAALAVYGLAGITLTGWLKDPAAARRLHLVVGALLFLCAATIAYGSLGS